ncbi:TPA: hypothetical protein ACNY48_001080 [Streptococcus pyogenes]
MKTKSKRFLNLATLCLALLGTTLLTTQPAEAEVILYRPDWTSRGSDSQAKSQAKDDPYQRGREEGHRAGLEAAKKGGNSTISPGDVPEPYGPDEHKNSLYRSGYTDMYRHGYLKVVTLLMEMKNVEMKNVEMKNVETKKQLLMI